MPSRSLLRGLHCPALGEPNFMSHWDLEEPCKAPSYPQLLDFPIQVRFLSQLREGQSVRPRRNAFIPDGVGLEGGSKVCGQAPLSPAMESPLHAGAACSPQLFHPLCLCRSPAPRKGTDTATEVGPRGASWPWLRRVCPEPALLFCPRSESGEPGEPRCGLITSGPETHVVLFPSQGEPAAVCFQISVNSVHLSV